MLDKDATKISTPVFISSWHKTSKQRPSNVHNVQITLYINLKITLCASRVTTDFDSKVSQVQAKDFATFNHVLNSFFTFCNVSVSIFEEVIFISHVVCY